VPASAPATPLVRTPATVKAPVQPPPPAPAKSHAPALAPAKSQSLTSARAEAPGKAQEGLAVVPANAGVPEPAQAASAGAPAQNIIWLAELPLPLQQELPPMTISVHAYSARPGDRMVGINDRMLREGEYVVPGLKLEQITPEGMVFAYKGYSFRRGVK
jgi:general secretion pathway protein B